MNGNKKKVIAGTVALTMALSGAVYATGSTSRVSGSIADAKADAVAFVSGDVNGDGSVTLEDAQLALKGALKIKTDFTELQLYAADVDSNDKLELTDAQMILKAALKIQALPDKEAPVTSETPSQTEVPDESQAPEVSEDTKISEAPVVSKKPATRPPQPSEVPVTPPVRTPVPTAATIPAVEPADYVVTGQAAEMIATYGAVEADGIYTFTDANRAAMSGIEFKWPFSGRTDLRQTVTEAGVTVDDTVSVPKQYLEQGSLEKILAEKGTIDYDYPRPQWTKGVSISFWSKQKWDMDDQSNAGPLLTIKRSYFCDWCYQTGYDPGYGGPIKHHGAEKDNCDFGLIVYANGTVSFAAGDEAKNGFHAGSYFADKNNEWTHYTVTIANDFITVYVNGQELVYQSINLDKDASSECFNDGFMTRYNPAGLVTEEMIKNDIRGYLTAPTINSSKSSACTYNQLEKRYITNWEATILGNGRYKENPDSAGYNLLMDLLTQNNVKMYLGGRPTDDVCCIKSSGTGYAEYDTPTGSQATGVVCYDSELKPAEVAAVYEASKTEYKDVLGLE